MYAALTYFGQGKLICTSTTAADNGKTVTVTDGKKTWTGVMTNGICVFTLPTKQKYTIKLLNGNVVEYETEAIFGFGEYKEVEVGMDKTSWKGLKAIVNAGLETEMLAVGDRISATVAGEEQVFDIVHIDYRPSVYGRNVILGKHDALSEARAVNYGSTNAGGFQQSEVSRYLDDSYYNSLPADMKSVITKMTYMGGTGGTNSDKLQNEEHMIWLPLEANVIGKQVYSYPSEITKGGAEQFAYYATIENRIKRFADTQVTTQWWTSSPRIGYGGDWVYLNKQGTENVTPTSNTFGIVPHVMIAADAE